MTDIKYSDVRVGDLVKATSKKDPEEYLTARAVYVSPYDGGMDVKGHDSLPSRDWTFEVLDRPLPPIPADLLAGSRDAYNEVKGFEVAPNLDALTAVINFVRKYDAEHDNKENNK